MNIIEAIKSGKPFKRKSWTNGAWYILKNGLRYSNEDVIAGDWELEEKTISITESQFDEAAKHMSCSGSGFEERIKILKENLGF